MDNQVEIKKKSTSNVLLPGFKCPSLYNTHVVMKDGVTKSFPIFEFKKSYVVLLFFPMDSSVDYSELMAFKGNLKKFARNDCQVVGVTSDSLIAIENWMKLEPNQGGTGGPVNFPIISDKTMNVSKMFGVARPNGIPDRATFILDKNMFVKHSSVCPRVVDRSVEEVMRTLKAIKKIDQKIRDNTEKLCVACSNGDNETVEHILGGGDVDINGYEYGGTTPLINAVAKGHLDIVRRLLLHPGIQLGKRDRIGTTALHHMVPWLHSSAHAYGVNRLSIVQLLCQDRGCSPGVVNKKDDISGITPLMKAVKKGHLDIVRELDIEGTDFFTKDSYGRSLMEVATERNNVDVMEYLVERNKVDSLRVIAAHNVARFVETKANVEALEIPGTVRQYLAGFVNDDE